MWTERNVEDTLKNWRLAQQQERLRQENQRRCEEDKDKFRRNDANQNDSFLNDSELTNNSGQGYGDARVTVATNSLADSQEMKAKRSEVARKVLPLASNQMLRDLLQDLCDNADEQTLNIIMKHVW